MRIVIRFHIGRMNVSLCSLSNSRAHRSQRSRDASSSPSFELTVQTTIADSSLPFLPFHFCLHFSQYSSAINIASPFKGGLPSLSLLDIPTPWLLATFFLLLSLYLLFAPSQRGYVTVSYQHHLLPLLVLAPSLYDQKN